MDTKGDGKKHAAITKYRLADGSSDVAVYAQLLRTRVVPLKHRSHCAFLSSVMVSEEEEAAARRDEGEGVTVGPQQRGGMTIGEVAASG